MQRRPSALIPGHHVRAVLQQHLHDSKVSLACRPIQRRLSVLGPRRHVRPGVQQFLDFCHVARLCRRNQRRPSAGRGGGDEQQDEQQHESECACGHGVSFLGRVRRGPTVKYASVSGAV